MIPFLKKLKTKIVGLLGHDFFAFMFKNRREHLSYAKELKSLYPKPDKMTALGNYELPSSVLDSLNFDSIIITGGVEFHIEFEELLDNICNASFHFFEVDKRSIDWFKLNKEKSNFKGALAMINLYYGISFISIGDIHKGAYYLGIASKNAASKEQPLCFKKRDTLNAS